MVVVRMGLDRNPPDKEVAYDAFFEVLAEGIAP
jgi:hypothetical protein